MVPNMRVNGSLLIINISGAEKENKSGLMDLFLKDGGKIKEIILKEELLQLMVMFMKVNALMVNHMDSEYILMQMGNDMRVIGRMIKSMEMQLKLGLMAENSKDNFLKIRKMVKV